MEGLGDRHCARALLVCIAVLSCGAFASMVIGHQHRARKARAGSEPFATFHLLDQRLSILGQQSATLQKTLNSPQSENVKSASPAWRSTATQMGHTLEAIKKLALRLQRRYHKRPFGSRLFGRLRTRASSVESALKIIRSADTPARASPAASDLDKRILALGLQYNAITDGYAALHCAPGEWTCCEPKRQQEAAPPDACHWLCTKQPQRCRGFVGARAARKK